MKSFGRPNARVKNWFELFLSSIKLTLAPLGREKPVDDVASLSKGMESRFTPAMFSA